MHNYDFTKFSKAVQKQFEEMSKHRILYKIDVDSDSLYQTYLDAFPAGTNDIFRERAHHDCSCCRQFIKNLGKVVAIENDELVTVWDVECNEYPYDEVAIKMKEFVSKQRIGTVFLTGEPKFGTEFNLELLEDKTTRRWDHFVGIVDKKHLSNNATSVIAEFRSEFDVLKRGLDELSLSAIQTVHELIADKLLYRGEEHTGLVTEF